MTVDDAGFDRGVSLAWPLRHQILVSSATVVDPAVYVDFTAGPEDAVPGVPLYPPARFFDPYDDAPDPWEDPSFTVITAGPDTGRIFTWVAPRTECLLNGNEAAECLLAPSSPTGYDYAYGSGHSVLDDGSVVRTANIGGGVAHAPDHWPMSMAQDHYANTASQLMRVRYGERDQMIYAAGALWPYVTWGDVAMLRGSGLSGDWRWVRSLGAHDMAGAQMVNTQGFRSYPRPASMFRRLAASVGARPILVGGFAGPHVPSDLQEEPMLIDTSRCPTHGGQAAPRTPVTACACQQVQPMQAAGAPAPPAPPQNAPADAPGSTDPAVAQLEQQVADLTAQVEALAAQYDELSQMVMGAALEGVDAIPAALPALS